MLEPRGSKTHSGIDFSETTRIRRISDFCYPDERSPIFYPSRLTHPEFADVLLQAKKAGVNILAMDCMVTPDSIEIDQHVPIQL